MMQKLLKFIKLISVAAVALGTVDLAVLSPMTWPINCVVCTFSALAHALLVVAAQTYDHRGTQPQTRSFIWGVILHQLALFVLYSLRATGFVSLHAYPTVTAAQDMFLSLSELSLGVAVIAGLYRVVPNASPEAPQLPVVRFLLRFQSAVICTVIGLAVCSSLFITFGWRRSHEQIWCIASGGLSVAACCAVAIYVWVLTKGPTFRHENGKWWPLVAAGCVLSVALQPWHYYMIRHSLGGLYFSLLLLPRVAVMWATYNRIVSLTCSRDNSAPITL